MVPLPECSWSASHLVYFYTIRLAVSPYLASLHGLDCLKLPCLVELGFGRLKLVSGAALGRPEENIPRGITPNVFAAKRLSHNTPNLTDVMLSKAKHLAFSGCYKVEILRRRLRMTLRHSLQAGNPELTPENEKEFRRNRVLRALSDSTKGLPGINRTGYPCTQRSTSISYPLSCEISKGFLSGSKPRYSAMGRLDGRLLMQPSGRASKKFSRSVTSQPK